MQPAGATSLKYRTVAGRHVNQAVAELAHHKESLLPVSVIQTSFVLVYGLSAGHVASVNVSAGGTVPCACIRTAREVFAKAITAARGASNRGSSSWNLDVGVQRREGLIGGGLCGVIEELVGSACYAARC